MERTRAREDSGAEAIGPDVVGVDTEASAQRLRSFPELVGALRGADGVARRRLAGDINRVLLAMRAPGHEAEEAELVMQALSSRALHGLEDGEGRSCRKEAVETVMVCGFPHALLLEPEDVAFARQFRDREGVAADASSPWETAMTGHRRTVAVLLALGQLASLVAVGASGGLGGGLGDVAMGVIGLLGLGCAAVLGVTRPRDLNTGLWGLMIVVTAIAGAVVASWQGSWSAAIAPLSAAVGLFAALGPLYEGRADAPVPGEWDFVPGDRR